MRKLILIIAASVFSGAYVQAQPWLKNNSTAPQKLSDIIDSYRAANPEEEEGDNDEHVAGMPVEEDKDYHFSRWVWYWERHLDEDGYMVSPLKTFDEWRKWKEQYDRSEWKTTDASQWTFQGPDRSPGSYNGIGRINIVTFHPTDTNTFWVGSAGGGAWKTTNNGLNWAPINDLLPVLGVSDIDFNPQNPNTVYLCTGDRDASDSYSVGVLKSTDGGATWDTTGLKWERSNLVLTNSLVINPIDTNSITLATSAGIYKSYNGGTTWTNVFNGFFIQMVYNPADTNVILAAGRTANVNQVYRSLDGGATWQATTNFTSNSRISIAVAESDPKIAKAIVANSSYGLLGIYGSTDSGATFTQLFNDGTACSTNLLANSPKGNACDGQGFYDLTIAINPINKDEVVIGGVNTWYSTDGGSSWTIANQWTSSVPGITVVHADKHYHRYHPLRPNALYECNDGGIYFTNDINGKAWNDITNGLGITQFYRNSVSGVASFAIGGAQDNGTKKIENGVYTELTGGDGMDNQMDYTDPKTFYTAIQYGELRRTKNGGQNYTDISNKIPGGQPKGDWITPMLLDPFEPSYIFAGFNKLYFSEDQGDTWSSLTTSNFSNNIQRIARANNRTHIYFLSNNRVYVSKDFGKTWDVIPSAFSGTISDIKIDPNNADHFWVTYNGYGTVRVADYSPDAGWAQHNSKLANVPVNCVAIDPLDARVYIGTDIGIFVKHPTETDWQPYLKGLPTVEVADLAINNTTAEIWAATYGRGMWKSPLMSFPLNVSTIPYASDVITIAPNPNMGNFTIHTSNAIVKGQEVVVRIMGINGVAAWKNSVKINNNGQASIKAELPKGFYTVDIESGSNIIARSKMIVY